MTIWRPSCCNYDHKNSNPTSCCNDDHRVQILDYAVWISDSTNAPEKGIHSTILSS